MLLRPEATAYSFTQNTVVVKKDMNVLNIGGGNKPGSASNIRITHNLFVKEGGPASSAPIMKLHGDSKAENIVIRDNAFWNWSPDGDEPLVADPLLERAADGDHLLLLPARSHVRTAGMGNIADDAAIQELPLEN